MSDYKVPQDNKTTDDEDDDVVEARHKHSLGDLKLNFQHTYSICEYSPVTPDLNDPTTPLVRLLEIITL